eukprot:TRINITY_DN40551_c0_g1_i1.p1 TRINITY_DN40551_c0_g1~~TRINITY_DN40551_c0_g1_i1.p1  ORF type:complete len:420 (+),score=61.94 TRINITY_DN40551_c0_g1_i1:106-1365(+)
MEALLGEYKAKCGEERAVREQLETAQFDVQLLRIQLQAFGVLDGGSCIPTRLRAGNDRCATEKAFAEHKGLLEWLAEVVDIASQSAEFFASGAVQIGGERLALGRMVQYRLSVSSTPLRLNVHVDFARELVQVLSRTRRGALRQVELAEFAESWRLIAAELTSDGKIHPAIFLIHRKSLRGIIIAAWPSLQDIVATRGPSATAESSILDPMQFFRIASSSTLAAAKSKRSPEMRVVTFLDSNDHIVKLTPATGGGIDWSVHGSAVRRSDEIGIDFNGREHCTVTGPFGPALVTAPIPGRLHRLLAWQIIVMAGEQNVHVRRDIESTPRAPVGNLKLQAGVAFADDGEVGLDYSAERTRMLGVSSGDRVEVEFEGEWFAGVLQGIDGDMARILCDVDELCVITLAHISFVRRMAQADIVR